MSALKEYPSYERLCDLAENVIDFHEDGVSVKRIEEMCASAHGIKMLYGTERVNESVLDALYRMAEEANVFEKMAAMQNGEMINTIEGCESEDRMVLHTAMRDFFENRNESPNAKAATEEAFKELEKLKNFLADIEKEGFTDLVQVGIGGSDLGPRAIYLALEAFKRDDRNVHFISNVDP
ncbi:MAG: glucose-6-phosphate isomerase, partial [Simkaniaceae bacterium]|nr:glucose-6-phosphate isomerase [Simkaniaceae bacterium]